MCRPSEIDVYYFPSELPLRAPERCSVQRRCGESFDYPYIQQSLSNQSRHILSHPILTVLDLDGFHLNQKTSTSRIVPFEEDAP